MAESIFLPAFGNKPTHLVGRDAVVAGFVSGLRESVGHQERTTLLIGQRGMGKTALLLEFADQAQRQGFVVARVTANTDMLADILGMIQRKGTELIGAKTKPKIKGVSAGAFGFSFGLTFAEEVERNYSFLNKMLMLCDELEKHGKGIVVLVDEIQAADSNMRVLATAYQNLVGEGKNIVIAMAGLPSVISSVLNDDMLTFLNRATKVHLDALSLNDVSAYYVHAFSDLGLSIGADDLEMAVRATRGYPYLLQLIGYYLTKHAGSNKSIDSSAVSQALTAARRDLIKSIYDPILKPLSKRDMQFLKAMARDKGSVSTVSDIVKRMKTTQGNVQAYRRRLIDMGVIASERRGELSFAVPYLKEYLSS
jgi:hypothetical protein